MPGRARTLPLLLVLPLVAGCIPRAEPPTVPTATATVTVTATPTPETQVATPSSPGGEALLGVRTVHEAWSSLDVQCRTSISGDVADAACEARDHTGLALERTAIGAYVRAWHARDEEALTALTPPLVPEDVDFVLQYSLAEGEEPRCEIAGADESTVGHWECTIPPVEGVGSEEAPGWVFLLRPLWGDERLAPEIYVTADQVDFH